MPYEMRRIFHYLVYMGAGQYAPVIFRIRLNLPGPDGALNGGESDVRLRFSGWDWRPMEP